ncbi:relaxase/mobilization nuclease domain-containing protein [[Clostridium] leptum]|nr:relaxase/mobilization nuclease domain-containing protein [[Clostridium] leptum]
MATFKHISSKNADYGAAEKYLTFQHDEFSMKPTLDESGRLVPREDYRIAALNCGGEDFAVACMRSNLRYGKNQKREDVKSHHYIISFDPRYGTDNGLTVDRAQQLGEQFCTDHFPGHQALVCTHPDGHNHSGNIHIHIVINSLRIESVPLLPYMDRPADTLEGCKHRCTDAAMEYFKSEVMEMCHRENLYQIDLLHGSKNRITEREYWAQKKGQLALDKENAALAATGQPVKQTKFETDKAKLRQTIRKALDRATTLDEFSALLLQQGVTVKESRGRLSYLTPDRTKPITARKLGDDFDKAAVLALLTQNAHRAAEQTTAIPEHHSTQRGRLQEEKTAKTAPKENGLQRMVDREAKRAEGKGAGYDRWAAVHNLKQMAATHNFLTENELLDPDRLDAAEKAARETLSEKREALKTVEAALAAKKELRKAANDYRRTRPTVDEHRKLKGKKTDRYYQANEADFIIYEAAKRKLRELHPGNKLPSRDKLNAEIEALISKKNALYNEYREAKAAHERLFTAQQNAQKLYRQPSRRKEQSHER